jgi:hypothetical protein
MRPTPKLNVGDIIEVQGFVMLNKLEPGRYRVKSIVRRHQGIDAYFFTRPRGKKVVVGHYVDNVDPWLRPSVSDPDLNKIVKIN